MQPFGGSFGMSQEYSYGSQSGPGNASQGRSGGDAKGPRPLLPVTCRQVLDAQPSSGGDSKFTIDGKPTFQCVLVGEIMSVNHQSTVTSYVVDDGTGSVSVKTWQSSDDDAQAAAQAQAQLHENVYVRVIGKMSEFQGNLTFSSHKITPITDHNMITTHRLEASFAHLYNTKGAPPSMKTTGAPGGAVPMSPAVKLGGMGSALQSPPQAANYQDRLNLGDQHDQVFSAFKTFSSNETGVTISVIAQQLPNLRPEAIRSSIEFLINEGHLFSTIDEHHFSLAM